jgi:hypothetical protein
MDIKNNPQKHNTKVKSLPRFVYGKTSPYPTVESVIKVIQRKVLKSIR